MLLLVRYKDDPVLPYIKREEPAQKQVYAQRSIEILRGNIWAAVRNLPHDLNSLSATCSTNEIPKTIPAMRNIKIFPGSHSNGLIQKTNTNKFTKDFLIGQLGISIKVTVVSI